MPRMRVDFATVLTVLKHTPAKEALTEIDMEAGKKAAGFNPQGFQQVPACPGRPPAQASCHLVVMQGMIL
jgi:hypothetical protein